MASLNHNIYIHPSATVDEGSTIGSGTKIWHQVHIMPESEIGEDCILGQNVFIGKGAKIGKGVKIQNNVSVYQGVICEDHVFLGPSMVMTNVINPRSNIERKEEMQQTLIREGVSIGANATIVCGIEIGAYSFIAAGAIVVKDVRPFELIIGNPGRPVGWMSRAGRRLAFDGTNIAYCKEMNEYYHYQNGAVSIKNEK